MSSNVVLRENSGRPEVGERPISGISFSACELDRKSTSDDVSVNSIRRASYVTAAESSDVIFLLRTTQPPQPDYHPGYSSNFTSGYTTQESGDLLSHGDSLSGSGIRESFRASLDSPIMGRWTSTGSLSLANSVSRDLTDWSESERATVEDALRREEEKPERGTWDSPAEFVLSCLGYAVGLGNVWRFPYLVFVNGGGAFLIPYTLMLAIIGIPVFLMELTVGQYSAKGPVHVFQAAPLFQGIGVGMIITIWGAIYYQMIITWSLYYLFASWQSVLPWSHCGNSYNTPSCYSKTEAKGCEDANGLWYNQTCYNETYIQSFSQNITKCQESITTDSSVMGNVSQYCQNVTVNSFLEYFSTNITGRRVSAPEEYFKYVDPHMILHRHYEDQLYHRAMWIGLGMLDRSNNIEETGIIKWDICLVYLFAWMLCYLCVIKGIKTAGKVVYFTATFPYLILVILFFRAVTLPGAGKGVIFYLKPDFNILLRPKVWADAAGQIFFSLSVGGGGLMTFASYNKFRNNIYRDTLIVAIGNCMTSFFAGFVIFSILGFMATELDVDVKDVAKSGSGLAFIAYPEIVTRLAVPQLWSSLFFFMLLTLGLDSMFAGLENVQTAVVDTFPKLRKYKPLVAAGLCLFCFTLGLTQCTNAGIYWFELSSYYSTSWAVLLMGMSEAMVFAWVYGAQELIDNIELMTGIKLKIHWKVNWLFLAPISILTIFIFNIVKFTPLSYGDYVLPSWAQALGWMLSLNGVMMIPIVAIYNIVISYNNPDHKGFSLKQHVLKLLKPTPEWHANMLKNTRDEESNGNTNNSSNNVQTENSSARMRKKVAPSADQPLSYCTEPEVNRKSYENQGYSGTDSQPDLTLGDIMKTSKI